MTYKKGNKISIIIIVLALAFIIVGAFFNNQIGVILYFIGFLLVCISVAIPYIFVRCPYCGASLARIWSEPKYCPSCGKELKE